MDALAPAGGSGTGGYYKEGKQQKYALHALTFASAEGGRNGAL